MGGGYRGKIAQFPALSVTLHQARDHPRNIVEKYMLSGKYLEDFSARVARLLFYFIFPSRVSLSLFMLAKRTAFPDIPYAGIMTLTSPTTFRDHAI